MAPPRKTWIIGGLVAVVVALAAALVFVLVTDDDDTQDTATTDTTVGESDDDSSGGTSPTTGNDEPATSATTEPSSAFVCPDGDMAALEELQSAVDAGHQPWRADAALVAASCAVGDIDAEVEVVEPNAYRVTDEVTGDAFLVELTQPVRQGPGGIWAVITLTPLD